MADLQAQHALGKEYRVWSHGSRYAQRQAIAIPGDAETEAALNGGKQVDASGRISNGFDPRKVCPCGITRSKNGASNCSNDCE